MVKAKKTTKKPSSNKKKVSKTLKKKESQGKKKVIPVKPVKTDQKKKETQVSKPAQIKPKNVPINVEEVKTKLNLEMKKTKLFYIFAKKGFEKGSRKAYLKGSRLFLQAHLSKFPISFKEISKEEANKRHLGTTRSIGSVNGETIQSVLAAYFQK